MARERGGRLAGWAAGSAVVRTIERTIGITGSGLVLLTLAAVGWVLAKALGSRAMFLFVYGLLVVLGVSWGLGRRKLAVSAHRSDLPARVREGQTIEVELVLEAQRRISTIVLEEGLHEKLGTSVRVAVPLLPGGEEVRHAYTFSPTLRGVYEVGPLVAEWSDPFGFTKRREVLMDKTSIIVHPSTELVHDRVTSREWEDPPIRPPVSKPWPNGFEFYGMRDYVPGDDPRRIIWRKTAQMIDEHGQGRYLVRESEQGITDRVNLYLDTDREFHSPGAYSDTFELAVRAIASIGSKHLKDGFSVSLDANSGRLAKQLRGGSKALPLLDELAKVQREKVPLTKSLERVLMDPHRTSHNVIVTPQLEHLAAGRLKLLLDRGTSLLIVHLMWDDTDPLSLHRAGSLGCPVVELAPNMALERVFQRVIGMGRR
jgi:uncharacterized protein (DUF58 family)